MPGPSRYNRKLKAKNDARKAAASRGGRTPSERGLGRSMAASGRAVSKTNLAGPTPSKPKATKSPLANPRVQNTIERLRTKAGASGRTLSQENLAENLAVNRETVRRERKLEDTALRNFYNTRGEALNAEKAVRTNTRLNAAGTRVEALAGMRQVGTENRATVQKAAEANKIGRQKGKRFTTPRVRKVQKEIKRAKRQLVKAKRKALPKITSDSLNADQEKFAAVLAKRTGLNPQVVGAWLVAEQGGPPGDEYSARGYYNFLNIGPFMEHPRFNKSPQDAANFTADSLLGRAGGLSMGAGIPGIVANARGKSPQEQAQVILSSGWGTTQIPLGSAQARPANTKAVRRATAKAGRVGERAAELGLRPNGLLNRQQMKELGIKPVKTEAPDWQLVGGPKNVRSAIEVLGKEVLDKWLPAQGGGTSNYPRNVYNLNPVLARQLVKLAKATGEPILVTSGYRSVEDQAVIDPGTNPAAPPGLSSHQFGMAADTEMSAAQAAMAPKFGLVHGEAGAGVSDPPHTELTDANLIREALKFGPIRSSYAPAGVPISEGDLGGWRDGGVSGGAAPPSSGGVVAPSGGGTAASGAGTAASGAGPVSRGRRQTDVADLLRQLGYQVTPRGIKRTGLAASSVEAPGSATERKKKYGLA